MSTFKDTRDIDFLLQELQVTTWVRRVQALRSVATWLATGEVSPQVEIQLARYLIEATTDDKWEVRKAAVLAIAETRHGDRQQILRILERLVEDPNRWVSQAATRAEMRVRKNTQGESVWRLTKSTQDPVLEYITERIRVLGLRSLTPAKIHEVVMEAGTRFYRLLAAETAHEIRTLLTPMKGFIQALSDHVENLGVADASTQHYVKFALDQVQQLQAFIEQLHTYGSPVSEPIEHVLLYEIVHRALQIASAHNTFEKVTIEQHINIPNDISIAAFPERMIRAVANVIANAYQAMPKGGRLFIRACMLPGGIVELKVKDTGHGMTPEQTERAVERFYTTRRGKGGTGLGLSIVQRIVEDDHGGSLSIDSETGNGTTVTFAMPTPTIYTRKNQS